MPSQLPSKHPRPDYLGNVHQVVEVAMYSDTKHNVWGLIYFFVFEHIHLFITKDTKINTAVHCMYIFSGIYVSSAPILPVTHEILLHQKAMVPALYCHTFLHLIHQLAGHVKWNERNTDRHLFSVKKGKNKPCMHVCIHHLALKFYLSS